MEGRSDLLGYGFDDEVSTSFKFDLGNKKIEISFSRCYNLEKDEFEEIPCCLIIEGWKGAKSRLASMEKYDHLQRHIGIITMVLSSIYNEKYLYILATTIDESDIELLFESPKVSILFFIDA